MNIRIQMRGALLASWLCGEAVLSGCASGPPSDLLALPSGAAASVPATNPSPRNSGPTLTVRRVSVPEYLASRRVRYWRSEGVLAEWPNTFWAERIEVGMSREFMAALRSELPGWTVCDSVCGDVAPDVSIKLDVVRLDYMRSEGRLKATAQIWVNGLSTPSPGVQAASHSYDDLNIPVAPDTAEGQANAFSSLLRGLAKTGAMLAIEQQEARGHIKVRP